MIPNVLQMANQLIAGVLFNGATALDGTTGNGHDTRFLAEQVGAAGHVYGFDIQAEAIQATGAALEYASLHQRVTLIQADHATLSEHLPADTSLHAAMFNLGYLPHGNKHVITKPESTLAALEAALERLERGGVLTAVLYPGHEGGTTEAEAVLAWAHTLPREEVEAAWYRPLNVRRPSPSLVVVGKR